MAGKTKSLSLVKEIHILRNTEINDENPGSILKDFRSVIKYLQNNKVPATPSAGYFSISHLAPMNEILSNPIRIDKKRPQKKSFPNLMGLYLLLRGTGLLIIPKDTKDFLRIDQKALASWSGLNDTEAYFTLLETWLIRSSPKDILDEHNLTNDFLMTACNSFWKKITKEGADSHTLKFLNYNPGLFNVSLLELFGFIDVIASEPAKGGDWNITGINQTEFGVAFFRYLHEKLIDSKKYFNFTAYNLMESKNKIPFGQLQKHFRACFPEWKSNLVLPQRKFRAGKYKFKISLEKTWRIVALDGEKTLEELADLILLLYEFDHDHMYSFYTTDRFGNTVEMHHPSSNTEPFCDEIQIGMLPIEKGSSIRFEYDFGFGWGFGVTLMEIDENDVKPAEPEIIKIHGKSPEQYLSSYEEDDDEYEEEY